MLSLKEIKEKSASELHDLLKKCREEMRALRFSVAAKQEKNIRNLRTIKKNIARILTVLKEKVNSGEDQKAK